MFHQFKGTPPEDNTEPKIALRIDPSKIVVVCISGYQLLPEVKERQKQEIITEMKVCLRKEKGVVESFEEYDFEAKAEKILAMFGSTGMEVLRNQFVAHLKPYGVPAENLIYTDWTESAWKSYKDQPVYDLVVNKINGIDPSYLAIFGHSYGGCTSTRISRVTQKTPDFVGLIDPIFIPATIDWYGNITTSPQDSRADNYPRGGEIFSWYQYYSQPHGFHDVYNSSKKDVRNTHVPGVSHMSIDDYPPLHKEALEIVMAGISVNRLQEAAALKAATEKEAAKYGY